MWLFLVCSQEVGRTAVYHLPKVRCLRLVGEVFPFFGGEPVGRKHRSTFWCLPFLCKLVGQALVTVVCFLLSHEPPQSPEQLALRVPSSSAA